MNTGVLIALIGVLIALLAIAISFAGIYATKRKRDQEALQSPLAREE